MYSVTNISERVIAKIRRQSVNEFTWYLYWNAVNLHVLIYANGNAHVLFFSF